MTSVSEIYAIAAEVRAAHAAAETALARFNALRPGRRLRVTDVGPTWVEWLASPDGAAYSAACEAFEAATDRLIDARPASLVEYCQKLEALALADLEADDLARLAAERRAIVAEGGAS